MHAMLDVTTPLLPADKPRYLMGVGSPEDLWRSSAAASTCSTACCRRAWPATARCSRATAACRSRAPASPAATSPSRTAAIAGPAAISPLAYVHHLFRAKELLAYRLNSIHNVRFLVRLAEEIRRSILDGTFREAKAAFLDAYQPSDPEVARDQRARWLVAHGRG